MHRITLVIGSVAIGALGIVYAIPYESSAANAAYKHPETIAEAPARTPVPEATELSDKQQDVHIEVPEEFLKQPLATSTPPAITVPTVPFFSQFYDISATEWQKLGCGIASLAMLIEYYNPGEVSVDALLKEGISSGAYLNGAGWIHRGLALLAEGYELHGMNYDLSGANTEAAMTQLVNALKGGPVIASVYYTFDPQSPIPHLVVINGIENDRVYYNDPSESTGGNSISLNTFVKAWKKRYIEVRPIT